MKNFLFKYRNITLWDIIIYLIVISLAYHDLVFDAVLVFIIGWFIATFGEVEVNNHE